ncbi:hypothetical protein CYB_0697 [Synechococcus sp. JA-2-3B'a(2-13)]|nr:hypothetical protein CYB_0697 [Synechococcus sp. JA-2-3B'a(2-13)]
MKAYAVGSAAKKGGEPPNWGMTLSGSLDDQLSPVR